MYVRRGSGDEGAGVELALPWVGGAAAMFRAAQASSSLDSRPLQKSRSPLRSAFSSSLLPFFAAARHVARLDSISILRAARAAMYSALAWSMVAEVLYGLVDTFDTLRMVKEKIRYEYKSRVCKVFGLGQFEVLN